MAFFMNDARAGFGGLAPARDGTIVELLRVNATGAVTEILGSATTTTGGNYTIDVTRVGFALSTEMVVRARGTVSGVELRSIVNGSTVNISPDTEAVTQIVFARIAVTAAASLANITPNEVTLLNDTADMAATVNALQAAPGQTPAAITALRTRLDAIDFNRVVNAAIAVGESAEGPGDFGNCFPLRTGARWNYSTRDTSGAVAPVLGTTSAESTGPTTFNGTPAIAIRFVASSGETSTTYYQSTSRGVNWIGERLSNAPASLVDSFPARVEFPFPARAGSALPDSVRNGIIFSGTSTDNRSTGTVQSYSAYTPPGGGAAVLAVTMQRNLVTTTRSLTSAQTQSATATITTVYARGIGLVSEIANISVTPGLTARSEVTLTSFTIPAAP